MYLDLCNYRCRRRYLVVLRNYTQDVRIDFFDPPLIPPVFLGQIQSSPIRIITENFLNKQRGSVHMSDDMLA
jgi:hypothetical protein